MAKVKVASFDEVPEGGLLKVEVENQPLALFKIGGEVFATTNICTHEQCELDHNNLMHGEVVECTCHGSQFNVKTGAIVLPPASESLKTYEVMVEGDEVFVET